MILCLRPTFGSVIVLVVQRIECEFAELVIQVRFLARAYQWESVILFRYQPTGPFITNTYKVMKKIFRDFVSYENREYPFQIGRTMASSLTGFIVGVVTANVVWITTVKYIISLFGN